MPKTVRMVEDMALLRMNCTVRRGMCEAVGWRDTASGDTVMGHGGREAGYLYRARGIAISFATLADCLWRVCAHTD